jgi:general secretion pathway protein I
VIRARGFTLIEVMVAMVIVAVALPALLLILYQQIDGIAHLRDRSLASWIASNKLAEIRLINRQSGRLAVGMIEGEVELGSREWFWKVQTAETELPEFYRVTISVSQTAEEAPLQQLSAFLTTETVTNGP